MGQPRGQKGVSPRTLAIAMVVVLVLAIAVVSWLMFGPGDKTKAAGPPYPGASGPAAFSAEFPSPPEQPLANPLGIAWTGRLLAVAESDAGRVALFKLDGTPAGSVAVPVAPGAPKAYPVDVATVSSAWLVVVDASGRRAVLVPADPESKAPPVPIGAAGAAGRLLQPTAVAIVGTSIFVADGEDHDIKVYDPDGRYLRTLGRRLKPRLTYVGGMWGVRNRLFVADSDAGRVVVLDTKSGTMIGTLQARMRLPRGIAGDGNGRVFVVDQFERDIRVFGPDSRELFATGGAAVADGSLLSPRGAVWIDAGRRLFITDSQAGTVKRFDLQPGR